MVIVGIGCFAVGFFCGVLFKALLDEALDEAT